MRPVTDEMRAPGTPDTVEIRSESPPPVADPSLGIPVALPPAPAPRHRLVALGDSLTHGMKSGAVFETALAYPAMVARALGWGQAFRVSEFGGPGGLPLNLEVLLRRLERRVGPTLSAWEWPRALLEARAFMDEVEDFWERGPGSHLPPRAGILHDLAVYGWDLRDTLSRDADVCAAAIGRPHDQLLSQRVEHDNDRAGLRVLDSARDALGNALTPLEAAQALGADGGVETLAVALGANNALRAVVELKVRWSEAPGYADPVAKEAYTVWRPEHFARELALVVAAVRAVEARHVVWLTVPHVTIVPLARGVLGKVAPGSRYFRYYTRPWIADRDFDPRADPSITGAQARAIDSAIDQYNAAIVAAVADARREGRDWWLLDLCGLLERLAFRRYVEDPSAQPDWWTAYPLPPALAALSPPPDTRFFAAGPRGREAGGLFSLDGVHPTTIGYGIVAQEVVRVLERAGVPFLGEDGAPRPGPVELDFAALVRADTLLSDPPRSVNGDLRVLAWLDRTLDAMYRFLPGRPRPPDLLSGL